LSGKVTIDGSATVFPLAKAMTEAFHASNPAVEFAVAFSGTGGGFEKFCAGQVDIADASRPINSVESEQCKAQHVGYIEVPIAFDSLSVVVNAKNAFVDCLTVAELKAMWEPAAAGKVTTWKQVRASFPAQPLVLFGPGTASGTFVETITRRAKTTWSSSTASRPNRMPWATSAMLTTWHIKMS
jgi:phosphate transport system substrate-binding protein